MSFSSVISSSVHRKVWFYCLVILVCPVGTTINMVYEERNAPCTKLEAVKSCESRAMMCENVNNACKKGAVM